MSSRLAGMCTPLFLSLRSSQPWIPGAVIGLLSLAAGLQALSLPETRGQPMLTSIEEALKFYDSCGGEVKEREDECTENIYLNVDKVSEEISE